MRYLPVLLLLPLLAVAACGSGDDPKSNAGDDLNALQLAIAFRGGDFSNLPGIDQPYDCVIPVALQPPANQSPLVPVPAKCTWSVSYDGEFWFATYRETWQCENFSAVASGWPDCTPPSGTHEWIYRVDLKGDGSSQEVSSTGPFAPDQTH